jgi:osmotically-inducible protein OsmY
MKKEAHVSDLQVRQDILAELEFEPRVDAAHIGVAVQDGVATLTGHVASFVEKLAAEKAALRVRGVRAIAQEIEVRYPSDKKTADDEIAARALKVLRWSAVAPADCVVVKVQDGFVTLNGQVDWNYQRAAAEVEVRRLSGVLGVVNNITLKPQLQITDIKRKIEDSLKRSAEVEAKKISISVKEGVVGLDGNVHDWQERAAVERAVWSVAGVRQVEDRLRVF